MSDRGEELPAVGRTPDDESSVAEDVTEDHRGIRLTHIVADDLLDTMGSEALGDHVYQLLGIAIHRSVEDDSTWLTSEGSRS